MADGNPRFASGPPRAVVRRHSWEVRVETTWEAEELLTDFLARYFKNPVSSFQNTANRKTIVTVFLAARPGDARQDRQAILKFLGQIRALGLQTGPGRLTLKRVRREDWAESWKRHFKPFTLGRALLIRPSWSRRRPAKNQAMIEIDPGLSFGTGQHPTTLFCLREIVSRRRRDRSQSLLDLGTGSGILAMAAARLGYRPIYALDFDPQSIRVAQTNAARNRLSSRILFRRQDLRKLPARSRRTFDLVCANLTADLLEAEVRRLVNRVRPGGVLVLAGVLKREFNKVQRTFESEGLRLRRSCAKKEWRSGTFERAE